MNYLSLPNLTYASLSSKIAPGASKRIHPNTTSATHYGQYISIVYHGNTIIYLHSNGAVRIDRCGYSTRATRDRINRALWDNIMPFRVRQRNFEQVLVGPEGASWPFENATIEALNWSVGEEMSYAVHINGKPYTVPN